MESKAKGQNPRVFLSVLMFAVLMLCLLVFFDVPVARQVFGFLFLTFVPGAIIVQILGLKDPSRLERLLISVGLSIAFLMIGGLLLNEFSLFVGLPKPLQLVPLMAVLSMFVVFGGILVYIRKNSIVFWDFKNFRHDLFMVLPVGLLVLSVIGTFYMNVYGNNIILMLLLLIIAALFTILVLSKKVAPGRFYVLTLFVIALSLLFHSSLISRYIVPFGSDVNSELFVFRHVSNNQQWSSGNLYGALAYGKFNSMLSITILPTFYSVILNLDFTTLFKTLYPVIFAFVPLCMYAIWQKYIGAKYALIAAFLLMAELTFYTEMLGLNREIVAELFFALLLLVILNTKITPFVRTTLFALFGIGLVTSHYGLSIIFLFFSLAALVYSYFTKKINVKITTFLVVSFSAMMFSWYIFTSGSTVFESILTFANYVLSQLGDFLNPAARGQTVLIGLGLAPAPTIWNTISRIFAYATEFLIVIGFIGLATKKVKYRFDRDYLTFTFIAMALLIALLIVPGLANTMNMTRFYHILLFFLAPLCVLGADFLANLVHRRSRLLISVLLVSILVPYFLFQTGFVYEVTSASDSYSLSLSKNRMTPTLLYGGYAYIDAYSVFGAQWLSKNVNITNSSIYSDDLSRSNVLNSYGLISQDLVNELTNVTTLSPGSMVYLSSFNIQEKTLWSTGGPYNLTKLSFNIDDLNKVYCNGASEVYKNPYYSSG